MYNTVENPRPASLTEAVMRLARGLRRRPPFTIAMPRVSHAVMWLLHAVSSNEGISSRELAELLDIRPSSLTEMLSRLETDGLVVREKDAQDMRVSHISLTEKGKKQLEDAAEPWRALDDFSDIITQEEKETFLEICKRLSDGLEKKLSNETNERAGSAGPGPWGFAPQFSGFQGQGPFVPGQGNPHAHNGFGFPGVPGGHHGYGKPSTAHKPGQWPPKRANDPHDTEGGDH